MGDDRRAAPGQVASTVTGGEYIKLPGKSRTLVTTSRLWLGSDHILLVKSTRIVEEYRRFYFPDVQGLIIRRTMPFHYGWAMVLFGLTLIVGRVTSDATAVIVVLAVSGLFLWLRGPACVCHMYTAVRAELLPSLHRLKTAERVAGILRLHIEASQGALHSIPDQPAAPPQLPGPPPLPAVSATNMREASHLPHTMLFSLILVFSILAGVALVTPESWISALIPTASFIEFLILLSVLVWQTGKSVSREIRFVTWTAVAFWLAVQAPAWGLQYKRVIVDKTGRDLGPWAIPISYGWIGWLNFISLALVGIAGLYLTIRAGRVRR
jgi:hypothetical protein